MNHCEAGHVRHRAMRVPVDLGQPTVPDLPVGPSLRFDMWIWDWERYEGTGGYCTGQDEVSKAIDLHGIWEAHETILTIALLDRFPGVRFFDLGSHVGWYSTIAHACGANVTAIDADIENLRLLRRNVPDAIVEAAWIGRNNPPRPSPSVHVAGVKIDIEGAEDHALTWLEPILENRRTPWLLAEVSPFLADHYPATCQRLVDWGYHPYMVPEKDGPEAAARFAKDPIGVTAEHPIGGPDMAQVIADCRQRTVLFVSDPL